MAYIYKNPNPLKKRVGDCVVRGISILTNKSWVYSYICIVAQGLKMYDMPSSNEVWGSYLKSLGYKKYIIPDSCPDCYTTKEFCRDHQDGKFLVATGSHVVAIIDGNYYDTWDSGNEVPIYYFEKKDI